MFGDDHAFEVSVHDAECENLYAEYGGEEYTFLQLHFHYPSEHTFNGYHSAEVRLTYLITSQSITYLLTHFYSLTFTHLLGALRS